eukprot:GHVR01038094.1.p1 GENE.GHVR01038094.1~~GHVR01038094.1.p1  ORF type:complete len:204 (+),score=5.18 GHVR01038094.1:7158-7769(+)
MGIGFIFALGSGASLIFYSQPFGQLDQAFAPNKDKDQIVAETLQAVYGFLINSVFVFFTNWFMSTAWTVKSERQMIKARVQYFEYLLKQECAWHDRNRPTEVCSKMYIHIDRVHKEIVDNISSLLTKISMTATGIILSLARGLDMALEMLAFLPVMIITGIINQYIDEKSTKIVDNYRTEMDSDVIEVFDNIKTVKMLGGEQY